MMVPNRNISRSRPWFPARRAVRGFTLVELLVVLVLIGLLAGLTMARLGGVTNRARLQSEVERIAALDGALRGHVARHEQPATLRLDLDHGLAERLPGDDERMARQVELGRTVRISRFLTATRDADGGRVSVDYTRQGHTETFAVELTSHGGQSTWIVFAGLTGQVTQREERRDVEGILQALRAAGADAD